MFRSLRPTSTMTAPSQYGKPDWLHVENMPIADLCQGN